MQTQVFSSLYFLSNFYIFFIYSQMPPLTPEICAICGEDLANGQETVVLRQKGSDSINTTSNKRGDDIKTVTGQKLHKDCRRDYIHKRNIVKQEPSASTVSPVKARRSIESFNYKLHCIFCAQTAKLSGRKRGHDVWQAECTFIL